MRQSITFCIICFIQILGGCATPKGGPQITEDQRAEFNQQINSMELGMTVEEVQHHFTLGELTKLGSVDAEGSRIDEWFIHAQIYRSYEHGYGWWGFQATKSRYLYFLDGSLKDISLDQVQYRERASDLVIEWRNR